MHTADSKGVAPLQLQSDDLEQLLPPAAVQHLHPHPVKFNAVWAGLLGWVCLLLDTVIAWVDQ